MKRIILHLGANKTGTTLVQSSLTRSSQELTEAGVAVMNIATMRKLVDKQQNLDSRKCAILRAAFEEALSGNISTLIVSNESLLGRPLSRKGNGLYPQSGEAVGNLQTMTEGFDVEVVYYTRPQDSFIESWYMQQVHTGRCLATFQDWYSSLSRKRLSWNPVVTNLRSAFGREKVHLADFSEIKEGGPQFLARFAARCGLTTELHFIEDGRANRSFGDKGLTIALSVFPLLDASERKHFRNYLQKHFSNKTHPRPVLLKPEQRQELQNLYHKEYLGMFQT